MKSLKLTAFLVLLSCTWVNGEEICIGSGLVVELPEGWSIEKQDPAYDFTVTEFETKEDRFSLYVGFHPWVEKEGKNIQKVELISRYENAFLVIHSKEKVDLLDIVMILERDEYGKTCFLHLGAAGKKYDDRGEYMRFLRKVRYDPSLCPEYMGGDMEIAEPVAGGNATR